MNAETKFNQISQPEKYQETTEYGSLLSHEGLTYAVTQDGEQGVPVPNDVAEHISLVLRLQNKVYDEKDQDAAHVMQTFNCRKSALIASGAIPVMQSIVDLSDSSGENEMFTDVERLLANSPDAVVELKNYADFENVLDQYEGSFPCIVHIFESDQSVSIDEFSGQMKKMHRLHSFLVLGEDEQGYVCFQKMGPDIDQPFMINDLSLITTFYANRKDRFGYFVFGPYK